MHFIIVIVIAAFSFLFQVSSVSAQQPVKKKTTPSDTLTQRDSIIYNPLLIIPFNPKFYISEADREITSGSAIKFDELRDRFRNGLIMKIHYRVSDLDHTVPLVTYADTLKDLQRIYGSTACWQEELKDEPKTVKKNPFSNPNKKENKTVVRNGQLGSKEEGTAKYMSLKIINKELVPYLAKRYGSTQYVFINQFEIRNDLSDYAAVSNGDYMRQIKVHYSIFNSSGFLVYGGIATSEFPASENNVQEIINTHFKPICDAIYSHIQPVKTHLYVKVPVRAKTE